MPRPAFELADIFRSYGEAYRETHPLPREQKRVMRAIETCRTATLGGHAETCSQCPYTRIAYNSCRNRHCPKCQGAERQKWLEDRQDELLPVEYFHVVFTLPEPVARIAYQNKKVVYGILMRTVSETLLTIAGDPERLGAEIGFFTVLHTWGQNLLHHPHVHCAVPGGGLSADHSRWISCKRRYLLPVQVLSPRFRRLFLNALDKAFRKGELRFFGEMAHLGKPDAFRQYLAPVRKAAWVVYAKPPFGGPQQVLAYLARYTHRTAITNHRILDVKDGQVTFQWKDYRIKDKRLQSCSMTLDADEFIRRFLIHTQPPGFRRIRYCGFLASRHKKKKLALCRSLLSPAGELLPDQTECRQLAKALDRKPPTACPHCKAGVMIRLGFIPAYLWSSKPPSPS